MCTLEITLCFAFACQTRLQSLESKLEEDKRLNLQVELLKKDKSRQLSQLTAQESVIDGLRAERKIWGQELAQQGTEAEIMSDSKSSVTR